MERKPLLYASNKAQGKNTKKITRVKAKGKNGKIKRETDGTVKIGDISLTTISPSLSRSTKLHKHKTKFKEKQGEKKRKRGAFGSKENDVIFFPLCVCLSLSLVFLSNTRA